MNMIQGTLLTALAIFTITASANDSRTIKELDWLIGDWEYDDVAVDGTYRDTGTRTCEYALAETYIVCESRGITNNGDSREYLFYFNYNERDSRFEMTSIHNDYPRKQLYVIDVNSQASHLRLSTSAWTRDGLVTNSDATISYDGVGKYVWKIRFGEPDQESGIVPIAFIDTVRRVTSTSSSTVETIYQKLSR